MLSKYKTIHILLTNVHLDCRGEGSSNRNASRDESVEAGDESVETGMNLSKPGKKHNNHVLIIYTYHIYNVAELEFIKFVYNCWYDICWKQHTIWLKMLLV